MIKDYNKIYNLGDIFQLIYKEIKPTFTKFSKTKKNLQSLEEFLFGERPKERAKSLDSKARYWIDNFYHYVEIINSFERLYMSYAFLCKFPRFRYYNFFRINELAWVRYHLEFYLQENYILRERTKKWLNVLIKEARRKSKPQLEEKLLNIKQNFIEAFKNISQARGTHVHKYRFESKEFTGIETLNLLISKGKMKKLAFLRNIRLIFLILDWKKTITKNNKELIKIYDLLFKNLRKILIDLE